MTLSGKTALVTGAGTGIGKGTAVELGRRGAKVAVHYHASDAGAKDTQLRIEELGGKAMIVQADVAHKEQIEAMVRDVAQRFGGIDILVNNAALQLNCDFFEYTDDLFDRMMHINLKGYWQCIQAVVPYMKEKQRGRIINIASVHSKRPTDFDAVYCMTKGGVKMLARESAIELARYGITVNTIEPGAVDVGKQKETKPSLSADDAIKVKKRPRDIRRKFPMGRVGMPSDVASMVCYIASDETEFMTGASIRLDGGSMLL
jgi:glucose 1-dehydrogenase